MYLYFTNHRESGSTSFVAREALSGISNPLLPDGLPVILDERWLPVEPWLSYFRAVGSSAGKSTLRNYGYDAFRFAKFLDGRGTDVLNASNDDITAFRNWRLKESDNAVSHATWQRQVVVVKGIYDFLIQKGTLTKRPWMTVGRSSTLRTPWRSEPDIRPLSRAQWVAFRDIGLSGQTLSGEVDESWRGRFPLRSRAGAEIAVTTGMRVAEFSTLLDVEIPSPSGPGASVLLESCAKYQKRRRVSIPSTTLRSVDLYRQTERRSIIQRATNSLWKRRSELFIVEHFDEHRETIRGEFNGKKRTWKLHQFPPHLRRIAVKEGDFGLESIGLFIGQGGLPISLRAWHATFSAASRRLLDLSEESLGSRRNRVTPHDLRHTFAVVTLKALTDIAIRREAERRAGNLGPSTLSEHISINPRLTVQRLLGHASPETTMIYLRYIEDTDSLIQKVFESWNDDSRTYAEALLDGGSRH